MTYKNHALNNFMRDSLSKVSSPGVKIVRVGRLDEDADDDLRKYLLREVSGTLEICNSIKIFVLCGPSRCSLCTFKHANTRVCL